MNRPERWGTGDPLSARRLNQTNHEATLGRQSSVTGAGSAMVGDNFGMHAQHFNKPNVLLVEAQEDFSKDKFTDNYAALDQKYSGWCLLFRFNKDTGDYEKETGYASGLIRVWDVFGKRKKGDVFYAVQNRDSQRLEALPTIPRPLEGITRQCLGDGWWEVEVGEFKGQPNALYCYSPNASEDEECDLCELTQINSQDGAEPCQTAPVSIELQRPIPKKEYVYAHDARRIPLKKNGHVRVMFSHYSDCGDPLFFVINGEYEMVKIAFPDYECCDGVVIQTGCKYVIVEGVECETIEPYTPGCP